MKVSVKKIDTLRREMKFEVPKERVTMKLDEVLGGLAKHAKIPGFRPGKAPKEMVEKAHGKLANEEMLKSLIPEVYQEGVVKEALDPIDLPAIDEVEMVEGALNFRATIDLRPDVQIADKDYKGIKVVKKSNEVTDDEIAKMIEQFKKGRGMDEKAEINDDFAKSIGFPSLEEFKKALKQNMAQDKERQNRMDIENQVIEVLLKKAKFDTPQSLVERQLYGRLEDFRQRMKQYGANEDDIAKKLEESEKEIKAAAEKDVRLFLILQKIAQEEKLEVPQGTSVAAKTIEFLLKEAKWEDAK